MAKSYNEGKNTGQKRKKLISLFAAILISSLALWLSFRQIEWSAFKQAFRGVNYFLILLATGNSLFTVYALGWRWRLLLEKEVNLSLNELFRLNIISQYANIIMPARLGELVRAFLLSAERTVSAGYVLGTIAVERFLDLMAFLLLWFSLPVFFSLEKSFPLSREAYGLGLVALIIVVLLALRPYFLWRTIVFLSKLVPPGLRGKFFSLADGSIRAFGCFRHPGKSSLLLFLTFLLIFFQVLTNFLMLLAFRLWLPLWAGLAVLLAIQLGNLPPSAPGKIGIFEYAVLLALGLFSVPREIALSYAIMLHAVVFLPKIILGGYYLARLKPEKLKI